jgi:hypothetical protein
MACRQPLSVLRWIVSAPYQVMMPECPLWGLVTLGAGIGILGSVSLGDMTPTLGSSGDTGPRVSGLLLLSSSDFQAPPIDWRRVEDDTKLTCMQVANADRLLHDTLALVSKNILHLIQVSLKKENNVCLHAACSFRVPSLPPIFVFAAYVTG